MIDFNYRLIEPSPTAIDCNTARRVDSVCPKFSKQKKHCCKVASGRTPLVQGHNPASGETPRLPVHSCLLLCGSDLRLERRSRPMVLCLDFTVCIFVFHFVYSTHSTLSCLIFDAGGSQSPKDPRCAFRP